MDIKQATFRLDENDINTFREMTEKSGMNQAEMFQGLLNAFEMAKAKNQLADRGKEIDTFQTTVNTLVNMFLNSLEINQTSEERIREVLSLELNTKDNTIKDLQEQKQKLKEEVAALKESLDTKAKIAKVAENELEKLSKETEALTDKLNKDLAEKSDTINSQQSQLQTLNGIIDEYKSYKNDYSNLEDEIKELNKTIDELTNANKDLSLRLESESKMKMFYEREVDDNKQVLRAIEHQHKQDIEDLNNKHTQLLDALEAKQQNLVDKEIEKITKNFEDKLQLEKDKLEFAKSKNEAELESVKNKFTDLKEKYDSLVKKDEQTVTKTPKNTRNKKAAVNDEDVNKIEKED